MSSGERSRALLALLFVKCHIDRYYKTVVLLVSAWHYSNLNGPIFTTSCLTDWGLYDKISWYRMCMIDEWWTSWNDAWDSTCTQNTGNSVIVTTGNSVILNYNMLSLCKMISVKSWVLKVYKNLSWRLVYCTIIFISIFRIFLRKMCCRSCGRFHR